MSSSFATRIAAVLAVLVLAACADSTAPTASVAPGAPRFSGGGLDTSLAPGGGAGGGGGGGSSTPTACGVLSTSINAYNIVVYTTRIGIGLSGTATNCGTHKVAFEVDVNDQTTDAACRVAMPHYIAARNTDPGLTTSWAVNSTLVPCMNRLHTFDVRLWDTKTGITVGTATVSAFL